MKNKLNVLSLFDGISCGQVALQRANILIDKYYASEIDKYAIKITQKNFPNTIQLGDITKWKEWKIDWKEIDLILAGSPCQGFSIAGKQLNFNDPRSKLFFEFVDILNYIKELNPNVIFLLENVRMKKEYKDIISQKLHTEPIFINSALISAQNRSRLYWTNIQGIKQPNDKNIYLKDIILDNVDEKYYLSDKLLMGFVKKQERRRKEFKSGFDKLNICNLDNKCSTLTARYFKCGITDPYIYQLPHGVNKGGLKAKDGKTPSMTASQWQHNNLLIQEGFINKNRQGHRVYNINGKSSCLSASGGGLGAKTGLYDVFNKIRRLTPIECERLQTLPDNYTETISDTQRYKCLGNGWTVDAIVHILRYIYI